MTETAKAPVRCGLSGTALKYIACITMLIDHIGASCIEAGILLPALAAGAASCSGISVSTLLAADRVLRYPEIKQELEFVYAKNGLTLTDAINVFFQQSLNAGGFPFAVTEDNAEIIKAKALSRLTRQLQEAQDDPVSYSEDEVYKMFGVEK